MSFFSSFDFFNRSFFTFSSSCNGFISRLIVWIFSSFSANESAIALASSYIFSLSSLETVCQVNLKDERSVEIGR